MTNTRGVKGMVSTCLPRSHGTNGSFIETSIETSAGMPFIHLLPTFRDGGVSWAPRIAARKSRRMATIWPLLLTVVRTSQYNPCEHRVTLDPGSLWILGQIEAVKGALGCLTSLF